MGITPKQKKEIQKNFKIPVDSFSPRSYWIISLDDESQMPTNEELVQLKSFCEFVVCQFSNELYKKRILEMALPKDNGQNTIIFRKGYPGGGDGDWFYRRTSWVSGPLYLPECYVAGYAPLSLVQVMDLCEKTFPEKWASWKQEHSDVFPPQHESQKTA